MRQDIIRLILATLLLVCLFGCEEVVELSQKEIQIYEGQQINPLDYLSEKFRDNVDVKIKNEVKSESAGEYEIVYSLNGSESILKVTVLSDPITLMKQEVSLEIGSIFDPQDYISVEDKKNDIKITSNVDASTAGQYSVKYEYNGVEKTLVVIVNNTEINLTQTEVIVELGSVFDPKTLLIGDYANSPNITIESNVDTSKVGVYQVKYSTSLIEKIISVTVKDVSPILTIESVSINQGSIFVPENYLSSIDKENVDIVITNDVDTNVPGTYLVTYQLGDIVKTLNVTVVKVTVPVPPTPVTYTLKVISLTSPIDAGDYATIDVQGKAGKQYSITVYYKSGPSTAEGLDSKTADSDGLVSWTWKVGIKTSAGSWKIVISGDGKTATTYINVR